MKQTGLFLFLTGTLQQMVERSYFIKITPLISHSVYNLHMARLAPHLTNFQHAVQVKTRAVCFHEILSLQSPPEHRTFGASFCSAQPFSSDSVQATLTFPAAEPTRGSSTALPMCLSSPDISLALHLLLPKSATEGRRDGAPHVSGSGKHQKC